MADQIEQFYERISGRTWDPFRELSGRDKDIFPLIPKIGDSLLEFGFGSGSLIIPLARYFLRTTAVELSQTTIEKCRRRISVAQPELLNRIRFIKTSGTDLPNVEPASVDVLVCAAVVEHVFDPYQLLDELHRVAKPNATLILTTPNYAYVKNRVQLLLGRLPKTGTDDPVENWRQCGWDGGHLHYFTRDTLARLLLDCGWQPEWWLGSGDRWPWLKPLRRRWPSLFSGELIVGARAIPVKSRTDP